MFQFSYTDFLSVSIQHPYYKDLLSDDFTFAPLPATVGVLEQFGLRFKINGGRLMLYRQLDESGLPFQGIDSTIDLFFTIGPQTDLLNITESFGTGRYWFSNLRDDGTYSNALTKSAALSAGDQLPDVSGQRIVLDLIPGKFNAIVIRRIKAGSGWEEVQRIPVAAKTNFADITVADPGMYQLSKELTAGGAETSRIVMSDELKAARGLWSVIHLQIKPADNRLAFTINLTGKASVWQYYLVESEGRPAGPLNASKLGMTYSRAESRYPVAMAIRLKDPAAYPDRVKQYVSAIRSGGRVKEVYLFESAAPMALLDGVQPVLKIVYANQDIAGKMTTPDRSMNSTSIIYKL